MSTPRRGIVGSNTERRANMPLLTGEARYIADLDRPGQLHARIVRSSSAHARIVAVDVSEALAQPGVVAVVTAEDVPDTRIPIRLPLFETPEANRLLQGPLARGVTRYVGEPIAVVVAEDPYLAEDAAELVWVDLEELEPIADIDAALVPGAPLVDPAFGRNTVNTIHLRCGELGEQFARADVVVRERFRVPRSTPVPMETRGLIAEVDAISGVLSLWGAAKVKHSTRQALSQMLGLPADKLRVVEVAVGGGFGVRGEPYPEDFLISFLALRLGRPVKWIEDRAEHFVAINHAREQIHEIEIAATADGTLLGFRDLAWCDHGAYVRSQGILPELLPALHLAGPYRWPAFEIASTGVLTNRTPVGTFRGPGMTEATLVRERMLDRLAAKLSLDPAELRRRNLIPAAALPFAFELHPDSTPVAPIKYESGDFPAGLQELLDHADYAALRAEQRQRRARGERIGIGLSSYVEVGAIGPFEEARLTTDADGAITIHVGVGSLGQGVETVLAQIAAEVLGVAPEDVAIDFRDTDGVPMGFGAFASRSTVLAGNAIAIAAQELLDQAAAELGTTAADVHIVDGAARSSSGGVIGLHKLGPTQGRFDKHVPSFSFGSVLSMVRVDDATGRVELLRHVVLQDVGRAINPQLVRGQLAGAAAQGIGCALLEELVYDERAQPLSTSFADYRIPTVGEVPLIETVIVEHPTPTNPLGIKGVGESGMVGTPAAIANAVADALGPTGQMLTRLPLTPARVRALIRGAGG